jgi:hypothetical protein
VLVTVGVEGLPEHAVNAKAVVIVRSRVLTRIP